MKTRPILFSAPMVRAILDGRKTQTRRVVNDAYGHWQAGQCGVLDAGPIQWNIGGRAFKCPYGQPGDRMWVKETFALAESIREDGNRAPIYKATCDIPTKWKPSIFMPRAASRITLEITGVRVERLQDISECDAQAEGVTAVGVCYGDKILPSTSTGIERYKALWDSINGKRPKWAEQYGIRMENEWSRNPWVWVIEFRRIEK